MNDEDEVTRFARKVLAGVARAPRGCGRKAIVAMLAGNDSSGVRRQGLAELSTFGLLDGHSAEAIAQAFAVLCNAGLSGPQGGAVTQRGWRVMTATADLAEEVTGKLGRVLRRERRRLRKLERALRQ
jgi:hypothetical protein